MAVNTPYAQLVGPCKVYLAPYGTTEPTVTSAPSGSWVELGATTGDQTESKDASATLFYDNDHQGAVKGVTPQEDVKVMFTLANLTHNHFARILSSIANITTAASPNVSRVPLKSGYTQTEYALVVRGDGDSPFGNYPAQWYIPRGFFEKALSLTRGKTARAELECTFLVLEDDAQSDGNRLGWTTAQTS